MTQKLVLNFFSVCVMLIAAPLFGWTQSIAPAISASPSSVCPRGEEGSVLKEPPELRAKNGLLRVALTMRNSRDQSGHMRYCYIDQNGDQAPTLRVQPDDTLVISLKNEIIGSAPAAAPAMKMMNHSSQKHDPCSGGTMSPFSTNLHFHGLAIAPLCHQDDTLKTLIGPGDDAFEYRIQIPKSQPPGLYWYHPHVHGFTEGQILGGASGALIVEGIDQAVPRVAGLPERVLVIRDEDMPDRPASEAPDANRPTKQLSINYIPVPYPSYPTPIIKMKPSRPEFWRVLNASADTYLDLNIEFEGRRQSLSLVALDGVPLHYGQPGAETYAPQRSEIFLPPAGRAEFVVTGPPLGVPARMITHSVYRGAGDDDGRPIVPKSAPPGVRVGQDDIDPDRPLASIVASEDAYSPIVQPASGNLEHPVLSVSAVRPVRKRKLYFSEQPGNPADPNSSTLFFITEEGHRPTVFDPANREPTITVHQGDVEDWTIENRSQESHAFHIHQLHFIVVGATGVAWEEPTLRDTVDLPAWGGLGQYPSVTLRMDFRDPGIVGTFPFHCHILQHVDGGMMGTVRVEPATKESGR